MGFRFLAILLAWTIAAQPALALAASACCCITQQSAPTDHAASSNQPPACCALMTSQVDDPTDTTKDDHQPDRPAVPCDCPGACCITVAKVPLHLAPRVPSANSTTAVATHLLAPDAMPSAPTLLGLKRPPRASDISA